MGCNTTPHNFHAFTHAAGSTHLSYFTNQEWCLARLGPSWIHLVETLAEHLRSKCFELWIHLILNLNFPLMAAFLQLTGHRKPWREWLYWDSLELCTLLLCLRGRGRLLGSGQNRESVADICSPLGRNRVNPLGSSCWILSHYSWSVIGSKCLNQKVNHRVARQMTVATGYLVIAFKCSSFSVLGRCQSLCLYWPGLWRDDKSIQYTIKGKVFK